jgi:hypothetical protein
MDRRVSFDASEGGKRGPDEAGKERRTSLSKLAQADGMDEEIRKGRR